MRHILLASHGRLAGGMLEAARMILGELDHVEALCAYLDDGFDLARELEARLAGLSAEDELVMVTDILGGSVNNECMLALRDGRVHLVSGMNLCLVVELLTGEGPVEQVVEQALESARDGLRYCNRIQGAQSDQF